MQIMISGGYRKENSNIYQKIDKEKNTISYIPSWFGKESYKDYCFFKKQFKKSSVIFHPLDLIKDINEIFKSDIIYFEGGNTYFLLYWINKLNILKKIKKFSKKKILVGMSAGSIIQTPNINLAGVPYFNADDNFVNLKNTKALNLIDFEIYPHFNIKNKKEISELIKYSKINKKRIVLIPDGTSIIKNKGKAKIYGKFWILKNGKIFIKKANSSI